METCHYFIDDQKWVFCELFLFTSYLCKQERPAVADKPARRLQNVSTVYVRAVGL